MLFEHAAIYCTCFIISYLLAYNQFLLIPSLILLGWSLFGLTSIGHELYHTRSKPWWGWFFLDLWSVRRSTWIERHNQYHHYHVWDPDEEEHLVGGGHGYNILRTGLVLIKTYRIFEPTWYNWLLILFRVWFFTRINWWAGVLVYAINTVCVAYFTFITHAAPILKDETNSWKQIHRSVDIFPDSPWTMLIMGAFNMHTVHHLKPRVYRDFMIPLHHHFKTKYKDDYRVINTWSQLYKHFSNRHRTFNSVQEWRNAIQ